MSTYDNPDRRTYRFPAAALSSAAVVGRFIGPKGKVGHVRSMEHIVTTGVTTAAGSVTVDTNAGLTAPFTTSIPVSSANAGGSSTKAQNAVGAALAAQLPADTVVEVQAGGEPAAGAADLIIEVDWF